MPLPSNYAWPPQLCPPFLVMKLQEIARALVSEHLESVTPAAIIRLVRILILSRTMRSLSHPLARIRSKASQEKMLPCNSVNILFYRKPILLAAITHRRASLVLLFSPSPKRTLRTNAPFLPLCRIQAVHFLTMKPKALTLSLNLPIPNADQHLPRELLQEGNKLIQTYLPAFRWTMCLMSSLARLVYGKRLQTSMMMYGMKVVGDTLRIRSCLVGQWRRTIFPAVLAGSCSLSTCREHAYRLRSQSSGDYYGTNYHVVEGPREQTKPHVTLGIGTLRK